jgi:hypothetical protein
VFEDVSLCADVRSDDTTGHAAGHVEPYAAQFAVGRDGAHVCSHLRPDRRVRLQCGRRHARGRCHRLSTSSGLAVRFGIRCSGSDFRRAQRQFDECAGETLRLAGRRLRFGIAIAIAISIDLDFDFAVRIVGRGGGFGFALAAGVQADGQDLCSEHLLKVLAARPVWCQRNDSPFVRRLLFNVALGIGCIELDIGQFADVNAGHEFD